MNGLKQVYAQADICFVYVCINRMEPLFSNIDSVLAIEYNNNEHMLIKHEGITGAAFFLHRSRLSEMLMSIAVKLCLESKLPGLMERLY